MSDFAKLIEHNDHEGETWIFFLQIDGNEENLAKLKGLIDQYDEDGNEYELSLDPIPEQIVDNLTEHGNDASGYMPLFNKVTGTLRDFEEGDIVERYGEGDDTWHELDGLYKGQIKRLYHE